MKRLTSARTASLSWSTKARSRPVSTPANSTSPNFATRSSRRARSCTNSRLRAQNRRFSSLPNARVQTKMAASFGLHLAPPVIALDLEKPFRNIRRGGGGGGGGEEASSGGGGG